MDSKEAKDFLVLQATQQADLESAPLSDIEKRMMYFTESDPSSCPKPVELNEEFEAVYDTNEYETRVSRLLQSAHDRLKAYDPEMLRIWNTAIDELRKGDHYILVLWDIAPSNRGLIKRLLKLL